MPQNSFLQFSQMLPLKKLLNKKNIQHLICNLIKKGYIHFWCKITPYRLHTDPAAMAQIK